MVRLAQDTSDDIKIPDFNAISFLDLEESFPRNPCLKTQFFLEDYIVNEQEIFAPKSERKTLKLCR